MNLKKGNAWVLLLVVIAIIVVVVVLVKRDKAEYAPTAENPVTFNVTINNVSDMPLSPGVYAVHTAEASLDFAGDLAPGEMEALAEYGDNGPMVGLVAATEGVMRTIPVDAIEPGQSVTLEITADEPGLYLSGMQMAVASNDGYAFVNALPLDRNHDVNAKNYDAGTEENTEIGSGFEGGQPDPAQGVANITNGTATDPQANVTRHPQLKDALMNVMVMGPEMMEEVEDMAEEAMEETEEAAE